MENQGDFVRRVMAYEECEEVFNLIDNKDWILTLRKLKMLAKVFPSSIFVTVKKSTNAIIAVVSAIPTSPGQYVVGNLVVREDCRSQGFGKAMLSHVMKHAQLSCPFTLTLTAVPGTDVFYRKLGFQNVEPVHYVNYVMVDRAQVRKACAEYRLEDTIAISKYVPSMFEAVSSYDKISRGYDCGLFLSVLMDASDTVLVANSKSTSDVVGYAVGVWTKSRIVIDGLYADSDGVALQLYRELLDAYPEENETKLQEIKPRCFLSTFGKILPKSHKYTRMASGPVAPIGLSKLYAVSDSDYSE